MIAKNTIAKLSKKNRVVASSFLVLLEKELTEKENMGAFRPHKNNESSFSSFTPFYISNADF
jgi:hypothetical protein